MRYHALLVGSGVVSIEAFGSADAEARLEKEVARALPGASLLIRALRRTEETPRIVEGFDAEYLLRVRIDMEGNDEEGARRAAFASARQALAGTRFARVAWERAELTPA